MDVHINGYDAVLAIGVIVESLVAWAAAAIGGVYMAACQSQVHPFWSFLYSYALVVAMIILAMYAGSVR